MSTTINYNDIDRILGQLEWLSNDLTTKKNNLTSIHNIMQTNGWKGNNSTTFYQNMNEYQTNLQKLLQQIDDFKTKITEVHAALGKFQEDAAQGA